MKNYRKILFPLALLFCFFSYSPLHAQEVKKSICLNMIVKNESSVITRCLSSLLPLIDYWVIVDTGSTDGTQDIIKNFMTEHHIPGELYERPWVNFSHNRNEALALAKNKGDFIFLIDADEYLQFDPSFTLPSLEHDFYYMTIRYGGTSYSKIQLLNNALDWKFVGVLHEVIDPGDRNGGTLEHVHNVYTTEGARSKDPKKYEKDAAILEEALRHEPSNSRYVFYLARSYQDAGNLQLALDNYEKRADLGGWEEEVYWSLLQIAHIKASLKRSPEEVIASYKEAMEYRPLRIEAPYYLANFYREIESFEEGYKLAKMAMSMPVVQDILFVEHWIYDWGILLECSISAYWTNRIDEFEQLSLRLLKNKDLTDDVRQCILQNLAFLDN